MSTTVQVTLVAGLTRDYLLHHRVCPKEFADDGAIIIAMTADALMSGVDDLAFAYHRPPSLQTVAREELERLIERLTTRSERTIELARRHEQRRNNRRATWRINRP